MDGKVFRTKTVRCGSYPADVRKRHKIIDGKKTEQEFQRREAKLRTACAELQANAAIAPDPGHNQEVNTKPAPTENAEESDEAQDIAIWEDLTAPEKNNMFLDLRENSARSRTYLLKWKLLYNK